MNIVYLQPRLSEYDTKRIEGFKAMERHPQTPEIRTPTNAWAGLALSKTSPNPLNTTYTAMNRTFNMASTAGFVDSMSSPNRMNLSEFKDIHSLLTYLKLEHYIRKLFLPFNLKATQSFLLFKIFF